MLLGHPKNHRGFGCLSLISQQAESQANKSPKSPAKLGQVTHCTQPRATSTNHIPPFSIFQPPNSKLPLTQLIFWACLWAPKKPLRAPGSCWHWHLSS